MDISCMLENDRVGEGDVRPLHQNIRFTKPVLDSRGLARAADQGEEELRGVTHLGCVVGYLNKKAF